ncbi:MAG: mannonate dehydratase [Verrucomicrobiota bacterium]
MAAAADRSELMEEGFRWFGPDDTVPLAFIRQTGATAVFTSLHQIPYGEAWPREAIRERKALIEAAGLRWTAVESVPVHEDIKTGRGDLTKLFKNYRSTLRNLAAEGIHTVIYNFMPVLDWVRTDMHWPMPDGSMSMRFDPVHFAAFEIHALQRPGAEASYSLGQLESAAAWWVSLDDSARQRFIRSIIDVFPGVKWALTLDDIRAMLDRYDGLGEIGLAANLARFLQEIIPLAEEVGVRMAIHPDDPPFPVLGLPRIVSTAAHVEAIYQMAASPANGLCFCTGSFSARADNDLPAMAKQFADRIHAVHLRSTQLLADGSFYEADHLGGSMDMPAVVSHLLDEQDRRLAIGRADWQLPLRPDHGHTMMDDLPKPVGITPGYSCIGRMRGLAELRGLMRGLRHARPMDAPDHSLTPNGLA